MVSFPKTIFFHRNIQGPILFALLLLSGCVKDKLSVEFGYQGALAVPVATLHFTLGDALEGDSLLTVDADNAIRLALREDSLVHWTASDLLDDLTGDLDQLIQEESSIGSLQLPSRQKAFVVPFSELVANFQDANLRSLLQMSNGSTAAIPGFQEMPNSELEVVSFEDFNWIQVKSATLKLSIYNASFLDLSNVSATVIDANTGQPITQLFFPIIPKNTIQTKEFLLNQVSITNDLKVVLNSMESPGTGGVAVPIDLSKELVFNLELRDVSIEAGEAILLPGNLAKDTLYFEHSSIEGERFYQMQVQQVKATALLYSSMKAPLRLRLHFPSIYRNGQPLTQELQLPANNLGTPLLQELDFSNTQWRFDQDPDQPYNRMAIVVEAFLDNPPGNFILFSASDLVGARFQIHQLEVEEVRGYFGARVENATPGQIDFGNSLRFVSANSSPLLFEDPVIRLDIQNSFGIPMRADLQVSSQTASGTLVTLDPPALVLQYPSIQQIGQSKETNYIIDKTNSNLVPLLSIYPDQLTYQISASINPDNDTTQVNFIRSDNELLASAHLDLPFRFRAEDLIYRDTVEAPDLGEDFLLSEVDSAGLKILYRNGMPLNSRLSVYSRSADGSQQLLVPTLLLDAAAADANGQTLPDGQKEGSLLVVLEPSALEQLEQAQDLILEVHFQTPGAGNLPAALYTDYQVQLNIGLFVDFNQ